VIARASALLAELEGRGTDSRARAVEVEAETQHSNGQGDEHAAEFFSPQPVARRPVGAGRRAPVVEQPAPQLSLFDVAPSPVLEYLRRLNVNELTPIEALLKLSELQKLAAE
jgi:DNA mismatch repair protein MutS